MIQEDDYVYQYSDEEIILTDRGILCSAEL